MFRFLYLNMNYHVEHHMFPTVPYCKLPALHAELRDALPEPNPSIWRAYRELIGELWRQREDPTDELTDRVIPDVPAAIGQSINHAVGTPAADGRFDLGGLDEFVPGTMASREVDGLPLLVVRLDSGQLRLLDAICTHGHAHLVDGALIDGCIECPKHNGRFDLDTGAPRRRPVKEPLGTYDVTVDDDGRVVTTLARRRHSLDPTTTGSIQ